ncbi:MAG: flagellar basal body rod protein FlgC [Gammaproteobacteria bacterium]|uniref:flagellar basal body rod protein FlgC n=1 Tax=Limnobacter sp. TaxID=2003368 RepID=UPI001D8A7E70|nr:flagellar basal body rod protein FlgC [Gammaproteobacteria bacterium]MBU0848255.1 flagellar basal body rod protein FlgC [Gammaproteobacteria bacterium]MBU1266949.1 flagellar basal body rod protein FlgC [Gammaproteobacteria bacterium]MBU1528462.1 flagellar basal body rod protein FlgC [Gammaproteobacteria bacterium]MBU1779151.1 flagellar basal body rod protein FlgC [Gammaproteobacteria bacterium]
MSLFNSFKLAGGAMQAQTTRLNTVASNLANVDTAAANPNEVYQARKVVFEAVLQKAAPGKAALAENVQVKDIVEDKTEAKKMFDPKHPMADADGYVYMPNVNAVEEMVDMLAASRSYQTNAEVMNTAKQLMLKTLNMGNQ